MPKFWRIVREVIERAEIIIEVLDARLIDETRNTEIERKIEQNGKKILYVVTKCDLVDIEELKEKVKALDPVVYISSTERLGTTILKKKILELAKGEEVTVGILGYPNVGKSSLINALTGRHSARTSPESGYTHGVQKIRVDSRIMLLDTPGVLPYREKDDVKHGIIGALDYGKIKEPEVVAAKLIEKELGKIQKHYHTEEEDPEEIFVIIAIKKNLLMKAGKPNIEAAARLVLKEWQTGKIK